MSLLLKFEFPDLVDEVIKFVSNYINNCSPIEIANIKIIQIQRTTLMFNGNV